ncbi:aldehyde dehydrogenase family protein [Actinomadura madurae]|uniref:Gamma-glutamyl-gamma-aminobutyraldehyde dehydrogenase n=1 Tax=Actinomadura madurae TaxID=1993 RepID=A0A1I5I5D7_9ACTN|nr:aldehyde dehydrogenase family protein [Actinomadura madurae]SFO55773.1 gamma-glutamyl-gamma-aminobutyraldehyde dehydrogenase [Actinomadura madurae]
MDALEFVKSVPTQAFIDGAFVDPASRGTLDSFAPATGEIFAQIADCGEADVDAAVAAARKAFDDGRWSRLAPEKRKAAMLGFADLIESRSQQFIDIESIDAGKPVHDLETIDVPHVVSTIRHYAEMIDKVYGKVAPTSEKNLALVVKEPVGVVGAVLPWNFPIAIASQKLGPALAAGNSVVVKPPEQASLSTIYLAQLAAEAGIPDGVINVLPGRGEIAGRALGLHMDVDAITFTGSTAVGQAFLRYSSESNMKRVVLECGGKSAGIVLSDAGRNLEAVALQTSIAGFWNAGQNCTCGSRILVHKSLHKDFVETLSAIASQWKVGSPRDSESQIGPIIEASALDRILGHIDEAAASGAQVAFGGKRLYEETGGWFVQPTVIDNVRPGQRIWREEVFGPVVGVTPFETDDEAVALANDSSYGLHATLYTHDLDRAVKVSRRVRAGVIAVNEYSEGSLATPFGGYKMSGFGGHDNGTEALEQYTETKTIWMALGDDA